MAKKKIQGSLAGLLEPKEELEQLVSVIPLDLEREFNAIIKAEDVSMNKGVALAVNLFNGTLRDLVAIKEGEDRHKMVEMLMYDYSNKVKARSTLKGNFIGRIPKPSHDEFQSIRKKQKLKVFEATTIAATLLVKYYKQHGGKKGRAS